MGPKKLQKHLNISGISASASEREKVYRLMISQLFYDGHQEIAVRLSNLVRAFPACTPSDRLTKIVQTGLRYEEEEEYNKQPALDGGLDLECVTDAQTLSSEPCNYETCFVTTHKQSCRTAAFSPDGKLVASASEDTSIKLMDVERIVNRNMASDMSEQLQMEMHPVLKTLYDHTAEVTCLDFHPSEQVLASGGRDCTVRLFDFSKSNAKRSFKGISEVFPIRSIAFHPSGDYLLCATEHPTLRLYDVNTFQCFVSPNQKDQHNGPLTQVQFAKNGRLYVSSSEDGDIRIWDGVSGRCINSFLKAHDGAPVCSVAFTRNSKYLLSAGKDSLVKLWELSTARCLIAYTGAGATGSMDFLVPAVFNHTEDYVLFPDEKTVSLCSWDSRNAERQKLLGLAHTSTVQWMAHSPTMPLFVTCSDDARARFWHVAAKLN